MNLIWICADTFRNDHLGRMGHPVCKTPRLDRLADEGVLFENAYCEGLPTGPERLVFMTGKFTLPFRGWEPLSRQDITLAEHLRAKGWRTAMMCDCPHFFKPNCNYHRGFMEFRWIRGQEADLLASGGPERDLWSVMHKRVLDIPAKHRKNGQIPIADRQHPLRQYLRNTAERGEDEAQYFAAQTCAAGAKWLEDNRDAEHFLLWLELFDPHEPFDPPKRYLDMYRNPAYRGPSLIAPWFHSTQAGDFTPEELEDINALYNAEITHLDHWVGVLLDKLEEIGRAGDTAVVFVSDHGTLLGERGYMGKNPTIGLGSSRFVCNQPLIVRHPHGPRGKRIQELVWSPDYMPTCCEMLGVEPPPTVHGRSFWPLIQGVESAGRPHIVAGWHKASLDSGWSESTQYVVDAEWSFLPRSKRCEDELYSRRDDPNEAGRNLAAERPEVCERLRKLAHEHLALANSLHA